MKKLSGLSHIERKDDGTEIGEGPNLSDIKGNQTGIRKMATYLL